MLIIQKCYALEEVIIEKKGGVQKLYFYLLIKDSVSFFYIGFIKSFSMHNNSSLNPRGPPMYE